MRNATNLARTTEAATALTQQDLHFVELFTLIGWPGPAETLVNLAGSTVVVERIVSVPVNYDDPLQFDFLLTVRSIARGGPPAGLGQESDGKAQARVTVTHEFSVPAGYSVAFPFEASLGLAPPQLGVVAPAPVSPSPPSGFFTSILTLLMDED